MEVLQTSPLATWVRRRVGAAVEQGVLIYPAPDAVATPFLVVSHFEEFRAVKTMTYISN